MTISDSTQREKKKSRPSLVPLLAREQPTAMKDRDEESKAVESRLEAKLVEESKPLPKSKLARFRRKGSKLLHTKHVLMAVVILNLVDCILVLGELILDIHYVRGVLEKSDLASQKFIDQMEAKYPEVLYDNDIDHMGELYQSIYRADCSWNVSTITHRKRRSADSWSENSTNVVPSESATKDRAEKAHAHSVWEKVAHGMHKASIAILGILFLENLAKIFCAGLAFLSNKLEVFDAFIVIISFILDIVFIKGLTVYRIQDGILILSFLVPWRVIRVVNSLIVAVLDHEHFQLIMLYMRNKKISLELEELKSTERRFEAHIRKVEKFMEMEGIPRWKILQHTYFKKQSTVASMASLAIGGILNGLLVQNAFQAPIDTSEIKVDVNKPTGNDVITDIDKEEPSENTTEKL